MAFYLQLRTANSKTANDDNTESLNEMAESNAIFHYHFCSARGSFFDS